MRLSTTFVTAHLDEINVFAGSLLEAKPWLLAAVEFDDTGSTRIGKFVFNHPFIIPGRLTITLAVILGFLIAPLIL